MKLESNQIEFAANQIALIDSGEKGVFLETVNTDKQIDAHIFGEKEAAAGVYFSSAVFGGIRVNISFTHDVDTFNADLAELVENTLRKSGSSSCSIYLRNSNRKIIEFLKKKFCVKPYEGSNYYASMEFIMRRESFNKTKVTTLLDVRPYEEKHIDEYLSLLDSAMTSVSDSPGFMKKKEENTKKFAKLAEDNSFEAFWKDGVLIGLYWRKGAEIDMMAVASNQQRKGYGAIMLTRAIKMVFENTDKDFAYLYAVDWNEQGQSFYRKYGMKENGHSYFLYVDNYAK